AEHFQEEREGVTSVVDLPNARDGGVASSAISHSMSPVRFEVCGLGPDTESARGSSPRRDRNRVEAEPDVLVSVVLRTLDAPRAGQSDAPLRGARHHLTGV